MISEAIKKVVEKEDLTFAEAKEVMTEIMEGQATPVQIAGLLTALRMKGETVTEITAFAQVMREKATKVTPKATVIDTCGTGGDGACTINISTLSALVVAGAGVAVAKHGNRSVSSRCGSADLLEHWGVNLALTPEQLSACIDEVGIGFLFAPGLHPAMKYAIGPRKELGIRTVFNILGPLTNPAGAKRQVMGIFAPDLVEKMAGVLAALGSERALVVHGDSLDELTVTGSNLISEVKDGQVKTYTLTPEEVGLTKSPLQALVGGSVAKNAEIAEAVLSGKKGAARDVVLLNAAAALLVANKAANFTEGIKLAAEAIDSGAAKAKLNQLVKFTQQFH
mgnify:CR=1 FL=1